MMILDWSAAGYSKLDPYMSGGINVQVISGIRYCLPGVGTARKNLSIEI